MPATIETNKILAPFFIPEANIFVPYVLDFLFLIYVAIVSESPSRDLLKSASYIEAIIVFLSLMNKKKRNSGGKSGSKCTEGIYCTEQANKYRCSCFNTMYRCISWRCTSGY